MRPRSYFLRGLFRDVVIPDAGLVERTAKSALRFRAGWVAAAVAGATLLTLFVVGTASAALRSRAVVDDVEAAARVAGSVTWSGGATAGDVARVTGLRQQVLRLERMKEDPPSFGWGLYRGGDLIEPAQKLYEQKVRAYAGRALLPDLESRMRGTVTASAGAPEGAEVLGASSELYSDLRAYLLLTTEAARLESPVEHDFLKEHLLSVAEVPRSPDADPDSVAAMVRGQVDAFVDALTGQRVQPFASRDLLVAQARRLVYEPPTADRLYERIREAGAARFAPVSLARALGGGGGDFFATNPTVNGFYSRRAYREFVGPAVLRWARSPDRIDWVMGYTADDLPDTMRNAGQLADALRTRYYDDYITAWTRFTKALRLRPLGSDPARAGRMLSVLGDPNESPIVTALAAVALETKLAQGGGAVAERAGAAAERAAERAVRRRMGRAGRIVGTPDIDLPTSIGTPVDRAFASLHALAPDEVAAGGGSPSLLKGLQALAGVGAALEGVSNDNARAAQFFAEAARGGGPVADAERAIGSSLSGLDRDVRTALFLAPLRALGGSLVGSSAGGASGGGPGGGGGSAPAAVQRFLNDEWQRRVYATYQSQLAGRYPLAVSEREVPLAEFEDFFRPGTGTLDAFVSEVLGPLGGPDAPAVPRALRQAIGDARRIQAGLFAGDALGLRLEMQPEVPETGPGAPAPGQLYVELAGSSLTYGMGSRRPWTSVEWPGGARSTVRVTTRDGTLPPVQSEGDWSLFRTLDRARVDARSSTEYTARWALGRGVTARVNLRTRSAANPVGNVQRFFSFRPPSRF